MSRHLGPKLKLSRREGTDLKLKSCLRNWDTKCKAKTKPGHRSKRPTSRGSNYSFRFREKQKLKRLYGITESQFVGYVRRSLLPQQFVTSNCWIGCWSGSQSRDGKCLTAGQVDAGTALLQSLERRLDNVVYRMGFGVTRADARQIVSHKLVLVNGNVTSFPSFAVKPNDRIQIKNKRSANQRVSQALSRTAGQVPKWLDVNQDYRLGTFRSLPKREDLPEPVDDKLVLEFYLGTT